HWEVLPHSAIDPRDAVRVVDWDSDAPEAARLAHARRLLEAAADSIDATSGQLVRLVHLRTGVPGADRLLVVIHHLAIDGVSWRLLLPHLGLAWGAAAAGTGVDMTGEYTSLRRWAHGLADSANTQERRAELDLWRDMLAGDDPVLGSRRLDPALDTVSGTDDIRVDVPADVTDAVLTTLAGKYHAGANEGLLTALAMAVTRWRERRGTRCAHTLLNLEGHGREESALPGADISRTVGWFTTVYPMRLGLAGIDLDDAFGGGVHAGRAVKNIKEQLAAVPDHGIGYGLLRYLNDETGSALAEFERPQIGFNYLGRIQIPADRGPFTPDQDLAITGTSDDGMAAAAVLDINAVVSAAHDGVEDSGSLRATFSYLRDVLDEADVRELADLWVQALTALAQHAQDPHTGGLTPSDLPLTTLSQADIDTLESAYPTLTDMWPLSPLQQGLLFHASLADPHTDVYTVQLTAELAGDVDPDRLRRSGQTLLDRHPQLKAAFATADSGESVQIIDPGVEIGWRYIDFTEADYPRRVRGPEREAAAEQQAGFDMARPPLVRFLLMRLEPQRYRLVITNHHILLDGWSTPLFVRELLALYATDADATALPTPRSFRDYLTWRSHQNDEQAQAAWQQMLDGFDEPTLVAGARTDIGAEDAVAASPVDVRFDAQTTARLERVAGEYSVTINTMVQTAWAVALATLTGRNDIVFGATVSGRPPELDGVESMLGLFINTLPVRVQLDPSETLAELLTRVQAQQSAMLDHHHLGLAEIQDATGIGALFDTLTVFESYPVDRAGLNESTDIAGMRVLDIHGEDA
ncbi:MAG: non-ribosomal peptide synthetase, partial [Rhodococcus sp.]|nr:non-ribosomal peptide synthetase [Rhodococcus sp. (in: high G+C Gram-positive bacteria)]